MKHVFTRIYRVLVNNKGFKAAALLVGVVTWYSVQPSISFETVVRDVPIQVAADSGWAVLEQSATTADLHIRGSRETVRFVEQDPPEIIVDMRGKTADQLTVAELGPRNVRAPAGARVLNVRPAEVYVQLDREIIRDIPVNANLQGSLPEGFEVDSVSVNPETVTVHGPRKRLENIESVRTQAVDIEGRIQSFNQRVEIAHPSPVWTARIQPERVEVVVSIIEHTETRTFESIQVNALASPDFLRPVQIVPDSIRVVLRGHAGVIKDMKEEDIVAFVDCTDLEDLKDKRLTVHVHVPSRVQIESVEPSHVSVHIEGR